VRPRRSLGVGCRPLNFTVRQRDMTRGDWIGVGEYGNYASAQVVSGVLTAARIPHRIVPSPPPFRDPTCWIWVPPEWSDKAKALVAKASVSEEELTKLALSYPPPDDA
jgi:hypothetical protein